MSSHSHKYNSDWWSEVNRDEYEAMNCYADVWVHKCLLPIPLMCAADVWSTIAYLPIADARG